MGTYSLVWPTTVVLFCACATTVTSQLLSPQWPSLGQGTLPEGTRVLVNVDVHLEKLLGINQREQSWRAVHWFHLSWEDPNAYEAIKLSTQAWANSVLNGSNAESSSACSRACDSSAHIEAGCCDAVWLPHIDFPNLLEFNYQDTPPRWRIWLMPPNTTNGTYTVNWSIRTDAVWFSPYDFRAWPLEHQHLLVEMQPAPAIANKVALKLGAFDQLKTTPHTKGEDLPGWWIKKITLRAYDTRACYAQYNTTSYTFAVDNATGLVDLVSVGPTDWYIANDSVPLITTITASQCNVNSNIEGLSQYGPHVLVVDMMVKRQTTYYILINIVPIILVDLMVFVVYAMERSDLEARMGVVVTLVLATSALQFMYDFPPAGYLNTVQMLTVTSFVLFALVAIECMITSSIARLHSRRRRMAAIVEAAHASSKYSSTLGGSMKRWIAMKQDASLLPTLTSEGMRPSEDLGVGNRSELASDDFYPQDLSIHKHEESRHSGLPRYPDATTEDPEQPPLRTISERTHEGQSSMRSHGGSAHFTAVAIAQQQPETNMALRGQPIAEGVETNSMMNNVTINNAPGLRARFMQRWTSASASSMGADAKADIAPPKPRSAAPKTRNSMDGFKNMVTNATKNTRHLSRQVQEKISSDEAFALLVASRVDTFASWFLLISYIAVVSTLLAVSSQVGDHKLMLAGTAQPGNM